MKVKKEGNPRGGLMLRHRCYDGDVDFGIAGRGEGAKKKGIERKSEMLFTMGRARPGNVQTNYTIDLPD